MREIAQATRTVGLLRIPSFLRPPRMAHQAPRSGVQIKVSVSAGSLNAMKNAIIWRGQLHKIVGEINPLGVTHHLQTIIRLSYPNQKLLQAAFSATEFVVFAILFPQIHPH